jgi:hypothetical protein
MQSLITPSRFACPNAFWIVTLSEGKMMAAHPRCNRASTKSK